MNRFTNENIGIVPFQMVKLAATPTVQQGARAAAKAVGNKVLNFFGMGADQAKQVATTAASGVKSHITKGNNKVLDAVNGVGGKVDDLGQQVGGIGKQMDDLGQQVGDLSGQFNTLSGQVNDSLANIQKLVSSGASQEQISNAVKLLGYQMNGLQVQLKRAIAEGNTALSEQITRQMQLISNQNAALSKQIPGFGKLMTASIAGGAATTGAATGISHLANRDANKAHAAGNAAAKEGELAAQQNGQGGSWWESTWNDINKFREEHPGWFYGLSGVGLLGSGYALSEMLDDDDEEDEYGRY